MWNEQEKAFCIAAYLRTSDLVETRKLYLHRFNVDRRRINQAPSKGQVIRWAKKFIQSGTAADQSRPGRPKKNLRGASGSVSAVSERLACLSAYWGLNWATPLKLFDYHSNIVSRGLLAGSSIGIRGNIISPIHQKFRLHGFRNTSMNGTSAWRLPTPGLHILPT